MEIKTESHMIWYNFDTRTYDGGPTNGDYAPYINDIPAARGMYSLLVGCGNDPQVACLYTLESVAGVAHTVKVKVE